jgi:hypothetical protein
MYIVPHTLLTKMQKLCNFLIVFTLQHQGENLFFAFCEVFS